MPLETPLAAWHVQNGGKMIDFGGWSLPVSYQAGIIAEHLACRRAGGLFDVSHMGRFLIDGPAAAAFLDAALTNQASRLDLGRAHYTLLSDDQGQPLDDAFLFRFRQDEYLLVVNASNRDKDWQWLNAQAPPGARLMDLTLDTAMIGLQGPASPRALAGLLPGFSLPGGRNQAMIADWRGHELFISTTGYTGEPRGCELIAPAEAAAWLWDELARLGASLGVTACGLGARDTLRLEACLPLYGHELKPDRPIMSLPQARFGVRLGPGRGGFRGGAALAAQAVDLAAGSGRLVPRRLMAVAASARAMVREGAEVVFQGRPAGELTSGTMVPAWRFEGGRPGGEQCSRALGLAYLERDLTPGDEIEIVYRGRAIPGRVVQGFMDRAGDFLRPLDCQA